MLRIFFGGLLAMLVILAVACGGRGVGSSISPSPTTTAVVTLSPVPTSEPTATPAATAEPTATPSPEPTPVATPEPTPEPTATPESTPVVEPPSPNPVPGSCLVLEEKYCKLGEIFEHEAFGRKITRVGFHLPAGAVLFAPYEGNFGGLNPAAKSIFGIEVPALSVSQGSPPDGRDFAAQGALRSDVPPGRKVQGDILAVTTEEKPRLPNEYTLVISFFRWTEDAEGKMRQVMDEELMDVFRKR